MFKGTPYKNYGNIYSIAAGLEGNNGIILPPDKAIFSALCGVLSLDDVSTQKRILKDEPFKFSRNSLELFRQNDLEYFIDVFSSAMINVSDDKMFFNGLHENLKLEYMARNLNPVYNKRNGVRLSAEKTRREYFPTTVFFERRHYEKLGDSGILLLVLEEMNQR